MSANFYCWEPSLNLDPAAEDFQARLDEIHEYPTKLEPSARMLALVDKLLARYPDIDDADTDTVWAAGPLKSEILGQFINVAVVWSRCEEAWTFILSTAHGLGLHAYDPQGERFYPASSPT